MPNEDENFKRRILEELEAEGEDLRNLLQMTRQALKALAQRIALKLGTRVTVVLDALERIAELFAGDPTTDAPPPSPDNTTQNTPEKKKKLKRK